jgi:exosortase
LAAVRSWNLLVLPLIAWLYAPSLGRLFARWISDPFLSHGTFVPAFALLVLWRERKTLMAIERAPSLVGLPLVGLAIVMRNSSGLQGELFFQGVSLLLLLAGVTILLCGWDFFRAVLFPWAFLLLMLPLPNLVLQKAAFSLQAPTLKLAAWLLELAGVPFVQDGIFVMFSGLTLGMFNLAEENGICSLLTPLTVAIMHGYFADNRKWVRAVLVCSSVSIAIVADSFRIVGTGLLLQFWGPDEALVFLRHSGWLIFAVSLMMVFILHRVIVRIWGGSPERKNAIQLPAEPHERTY